MDEASEPLTTAEQQSSLILTTATVTATGTQPTLLSRTPRAPDQVDELTHQQEEIRLSLRSCGASSLGGCEATSLVGRGGAHHNVTERKKGQHSRGVGPLTGAPDPWSQEMSEGTLAEFETPVRGQEDEDPMKKIAQEMLELQEMFGQLIQVTLRREPGFMAETSTEMRFVMDPTYLLPPKPSTPAVTTAALNPPLTTGSAPPVTVPVT